MVTTKLLVGSLEIPVDTKNVVINGQYNAYSSLKTKNLDE